MQVVLEGLGKRFRYEWIFRHMSLSLSAGQAYAVLGSNGIGKSTFMRVLSGQTTPSAGAVNMSYAGKNVEIEDFYKYVSYAAPYIDLLEELTLAEMIDFHQKFKTLQAGLDTPAVIEWLGFQKSKDKQVRFFSSGMKQRLKLALAIGSTSPVLLLDEPTTNLDAQGVAWYQEAIAKFGQKSSDTEGGRLVVVASNIGHDYLFCNHQLNISDYK